MILYQDILNLSLFPFSPIYYFVVLERTTSERKHICDMLYNRVTKQ